MIIHDNEFCDNCGVICELHGDNCNNAKNVGDKIYCNTCYNILGYDKEIDMVKLHSTKKS